MILRSTLLVVLLFFFYSNLKAECTTETIGLCTEGITIESNTTEIVETTVTTQDSGDLLDGNNGFVTTTKEGDMDSDWGGKGSASMPTGSYCNELGTDKCAEITSSTLTTFYQEINISDLNIDSGGQVKYNIEIDKQDSEDRIYMRITGLNNSNSVFNGTDILSETGATTGYQQYSGSFDFAGSLNIITVEIGGNDINLSVGPLFDNVQINVLYNTIATIITQQIQSIEEFLTLDYGQDANDAAEIIFENNTINDDFKFEPIEEPKEDLNFKSVEMEIQEFEMEYTSMEINTPELTMPVDIINDAPVEIKMADIEMELEMEMELPIPENEIEDTPDNIEQVKEPEPVEAEVLEEPQENTEAEAEEPEAKEELEEIKEEPNPEPSAKQKAATKIVKQMGDKGKYDSSNQLKTLIIMQVLGNTQSFFTPNTIPDIEGFFSDTKLPDSTLSDNNIAQYYLTANNNLIFNTIINSQYK